VVASVDHVVEAALAALEEQGLDVVANPGRAAAVAAETAAVMLGSDDQAIRAVQDRVAPFGPLQRLLEDPSVEEIWWNQPDRIMVARGGVATVSEIQLDHEQVVLLVERMLRSSGRRLDLSQPFVDASLADGSRVHVAIPPITRTHWAVNIRRYVLRPQSLHDLVTAAVLPQDAAEYLGAAMAQGRSIVVAGPTQAGKTTMLNALLGTVGMAERIVSCEEVFEVRCAHIDWAALQTRTAGLEGDGEVQLRDLVRESLRMRPTRLVVGEVRQAEALDLLIAANSGIATLSTVHANSAAEALLKLCTLPLLAGPNISAAFVVPTVAACINVVVHLDIGVRGERRVREIVETTGDVIGGRVAARTVYRRDPGPAAAPERAAAPAGEAA
jgi:pilus assembly protein CpaF